jgi:hypothetical protein
MTKLLELPNALRAAGVHVRTLPGWDIPHLTKRGYKYFYREQPDSETALSDPAGHMHHHTAGGHYDPNRAKANGYAGLSYEGSSTLYQERYNEGDYEPVYTIANAYPAPISSGAGDFSVLERVRAGIEVVGRQGSDTPGWYGNTHYWNTEWICKGDGSPIDDAVWDMMLTVCRVQNELMLWTPNMHIAHGHHTRRKVDLWGGQFSDSVYDGFDKTVEALRLQMKGALGMPYEQFVNFVISLFAGRPDKFHGNPAYYYTKSGTQYAFDGYPNGGIYDVPEAPDWPNFWDAFVDSISLT